MKTRDAAAPGREAEGALGWLFGALAGSFERQTRADTLLEFFVCAVTRLGLGLPFLVATLAEAAPVGAALAAAPGDGALAGLARPARSG